MEFHNTPESLNELKIFVENVLGSEFVNTSLRFQKKSSETAEECFNYYRKEHPFAQLWRSVQEYLTFCSQPGNSGISSETLKFIEIGCYLKQIYKLDNFSQILDHIRDKQSYYAGVFEARIACEYIVSGYDVEIIPESREKGVKTPDFCVRSETDKLYIECKSLEDKIYSHAKMLSQLEQSILNELHNQKRCWKVKIIENTWLNNTDVQQIKNEVKRLIKFNMIGKNSLLNERATCYCSILDEESKTDIKSSYPSKELRCRKSIQPKHSITRHDSVSGDTTLCGTSIHYTRLHRKYAQRQDELINIVEIIPFFEADLSSRVISLQKTARRQCPNESPYLVYINLPQDDQWKLYDSFDISYAKVFEKLNRDTSRINGVVLSGMVLQNIPGYNFYYLYKIIPNYNVKFPIPSSIVPLGSCDSGREINCKKGTVVFSVGIDGGLLEGSSYRLFEHTNNDGSFQLLVLKTWRETIRVELGALSI